MTLHWTSVNLISSQNAASIYAERKGDFLDRQQPLSATPHSTSHNDCSLNALLVDRWKIFVLHISPPCSNCSSITDRLSFLGSSLLLHGCEMSKGENLSMLSVTSRLQQSQPLATFPPHSPFFHSHLLSSFFLIPLFHLSPPNTNETQPGSLTPSP